MRIHVLGTTRVSVVQGLGAGADGPGAAGARASGGPDVGARKARAVLAALALRPGRPRTPDSLADLVWGGRPPRAVHGALHSYVSRLRTALRDHAGGDDAGPILTTDHGYVLAVEPGDVDAHAFAIEADACVGALEPLGARLRGEDVDVRLTRADVVALVDRLEAAESTWLGEPFADLPEHPDVEAERAGLVRRRSAASEARAAALLALGDHAAALSWTATEVIEQPLAERIWALHALALYRSGRQVEALDALRTLRVALADQLGLDPTAAVQALAQGLLRQDPALRLPILGEPVRIAAAQVPAQALVRREAPGDGRRPVSQSVPRGRVAERAALQGLLDQAERGRTAVGVMVGEPGIGKSALLADLARDAAERGFAVAVGRCSQDEGAPPLWPFVAALRALDGGVTTLADLVPDGDAPAFGSWERILRAVVGPARERPVLLLVEDLHWADEATHRALAHLVGTAPNEVHLAVVVTRRPHPEPSGTMALAAEALARRQSLRLDLTGLDLPAAEALLHEVTGRRPATADLASWHRRSGGNPFYLIELARLGVTDDESVPGGVLDVVRRRLQELPPATQDALRTAAVVGRSFAAGLVAAASDRPEAEEVDAMADAVTAGLLREDGADRWSFAHVLTRDAVLLTLPASQRARRHARLAQLLEASPQLQALVAPDERTAELARHWSQAGPSYADRAWPAARAAADQARSVSAHTEAVRLRREAVTAQRRSTRSSAEERFTLLMDLAEDAARAGVWTEVVSACNEAVALGRALADPGRVATAAAGITRYVLWTVHQWGEVFEDVVEDLRWALATSPTEDSTTRCRLLLALAVELYYDRSAVDERAALVTAGLATARRLGDAALLWWAARAAWLATWQPSRTVEQLGYGTEALAAAERAGDPVALSVSALALATNRLELEGPAAWTPLADRAEALARRHRLPYVLMARHLVELNLASMRDDADGVERSLLAYRDAYRDVAVPGPQLDEADLVLARMWDPSLAAVADAMVGQELDPLVWPILHAVLARTGRRPELVAALAAHPLRDLGDLWSSAWTHCWEAEAAAAVGDTARAARLLRLLRPLAGRLCVAGIAIAQGPVDGYLALAAAAAGHRDEASGHADRALVLSQEWGLPAYTRWLEAYRAALGF